jgi:Carbamoyl-phosphate synthase L chain, ATP binding domain
LASVLLASTAWWSSPAQLAIAIARAGCEVAAIYPAKGHPLSKTKAVSTRFVYRPFRPWRSLLDAILASRPQAIIPCDDRAVVHLHQLYEASQRMGDAGTYVGNLIEHSLGPADSFSVVSSRDALWQAARAENILLPEMKVIGSLADLQDWCGSRPSPWVLKADGTWGGHGVKIVNTYHEASAVYEAARRPIKTAAMLKQMFVNRDPFWATSWWTRSRPTISVEDVIEGRPANCVAFCVNGQILALTTVEVICAQSATGPATVVQITENRQMSDTAARLVARLKLTGFYGFDFMIDDQDRQAYLIEMNPRAALPCHLRMDKGQDLIGALMSYVGSNHLRVPPDLERSRAFAYFPQAWHTRVPDDLLRKVHHDVPWGEPELVEELLKIPWPDRSFLARMSDRLGGNAFESRSRHSCVFAEAAANVQVQCECERARSMGAGMR